MSQPLTEQAFETHITSLLCERGWELGEASAWEPERAWFRDEILGFVEQAHPKLWEQMRAHQGQALEKNLLDALHKELEHAGALDVLRHGFKFHGQTLRLAYFRPAHGLNPKLQAQYEQNRLTVTRQVRCNPKGHQTVDMVFALNGLPVATCELKNPATGQAWQHAVQQYQQDRDPRWPLFAPKGRALVHFAADPDEVHMTTRLEGKETRFLPFNRGSAPGEVGCGKGNPVDLSGYRTNYFWKEVLAKDTFLDILGRFMFAERTHALKTKAKKQPHEEGEGRMVFPRYHQWDALRRLTEAATREGAGHRYLIQHSAGSGKTKTISWLAQQLSNLHASNGGKVFDCVVVVTDRRVLDRQIQDEIHQVERTHGAVKSVTAGSLELAEALAGGTKIVVTTLQKIPFVVAALLRLVNPKNEQASEGELKRAKALEEQIAGRSYAVIVDEAHSSQSGEMARELKKLLGAGPTYPIYGEDAEDGEEEGGAGWEEEFGRVLQSRGPQRNVSFFAFTATPKAKTLEMFGRPDPQGRVVPYHLYSMRQAIEEGFILDVLTRYTTYQQFYNVTKAQEGDPEVGRKAAEKAIARFAVMHPHSVQQKAEVIIEHFRHKVAGKMGGRAKAMVVAGSRLQAVRYAEAFEEYIKAKNYQHIAKYLVAFSGKVTDSNGKEYTESGMNIDPESGKPISEAELVQRFDTDEYRFLLVANKYQTGFDQKLLCAMYVDKRLDGVQAVQTLSRLNRAAPGKEAPFVLDFVNKPEDILQAFKPYYDATHLESQSDPARLNDLARQLDEAQIYTPGEVSAFAEVFYKDGAKRSAADHAKLHSILQPGQERFKELESDELRQRFRDLLQSFVNLYGFMSQVMPYVDPTQEALFAYGGALLPWLRLSKETWAVVSDKEVELEFYRLAKSHEGKLDLAQGEPKPLTPPQREGAGSSKDPKAPLSEVIEKINERFGTDFKEEDRLFFQQLKLHACGDEEVAQAARANPLDKFKLVLKDILDDLVLKRQKQNEEIVARYLDDRSFRQFAFPLLAEEIFDALRREPPPPPMPDWIEALYGRSFERGTELIPQLIVFGDRLDDLQREGDWETLEQICRGVDLKRLMHDFVITILGTTYASRDKIPSWRTLAKRTADYREAQNKPVKGLLKGYVAA